MVVTSGKVIDGKVVIEGDELEEGVRVTVLAPGDDEPFELTPARKRRYRPASRTYVMVES